MIRFPNTQRRCIPLRLNHSVFLLPQSTFPVLDDFLHVSQRLPLLSRINRQSPLPYRQLIPRAKSPSTERGCHVVGTKGFRGKLELLIHFFYYCFVCFFRVSSRRLS